MGKKLWSLILGGLLAASLLAGCGAKEETPAAGTQAQAQGQKESAEPAGGTGEGQETQAPGESNGDYYVSVIMKSFTGDFWKTVQLGAEQAGKDLGVKVVVDGCDTETEYEQQIQLVESAIMKGANAIALSTLDSEALVPICEEADSKGIKIITFNSTINSDVPVCHVATDNYAAGELAGKTLGEALGGSGKYAVLGSAEGVKNNRDRSDGAVAYIEKNYPDMELIQTQYMDNDMNKAISIINDWITSNPDIKGIYTNNETGTIAAATVLSERGKVGEITHIGFDATEQTCAQIKDGITSSIVTQIPYKMGYDAVAKAVDALNGKEVEPLIDTGVALVTKDNLDSEEIQKIINPLD